MAPHGTAAGPRSTGTAGGARGTGSAADARDTGPTAGATGAARAGRPADGTADIGLTPREREVLAALVAGRTNGEIARALFISVKTASVHVSNILRKLDVPNREQAARLGYRLGVAETGDDPEDSG